MSMELTDSQQKAIKAPKDQPSLILASAGSGKTSVLCHRILHLIFQGVNAKNILAITFSRRAGQDLYHRLRNTAPSFAVADSHDLLEGIHVRTFHSFCLTILRAYPTQAGLSAGFVIVTPKMQLQILEDIIRVWYAEKRPQIESREEAFHASAIRECNVDTRGRNYIRTEAVRLHQQLRKFENSKKSGSLAGKYSDLVRQDRLFAWTYERYQETLKTINGIDFCDFPRLACKVLETCEAAFTAVGQHSQYILVDEFQDTDVDQFQLLKLLCRDHKRLTIVGDDDQQIYTWRGAAGFHNLMMFEKFFHGATVTKLEQNFRSTGAIVAAARSVISKNQKRTPKTIRTKSPTGTVLSVCECRNEQCEATAVSRFILSLKEQGIPFHEIAVLYRVQHVGLEIQGMLHARGIPCMNTCHAYGYDSSNRISEDSVGAVFHDVLAILHLVLTNADDFSCKQIMQTFCSDFYSSSVFKCAECLQRQQKISLYEALIAARFHLLGLKRQECLAPYDFGRLNEVDEYAFESLHLLMQIIETVKEDLKNARMKDVIMNLLQQLSPFRTNRIDLPSSKIICSPFTRSMVQRFEGGNFEFAGIKALLIEAHQFDVQWENEMMKDNNRMEKSKGYKTLLQQKASRKSVKESYKLGSKLHSDRVLSSQFLRLQSFIDHMLLKLHEGELGEYGACSSSSKGSGDKSEEYSVNSVVLSTVHQAKGQEWTAVILVRANEGVMPLMDMELPLEKDIPKVIDKGCHVNSETADLKAGEPLQYIGQHDGFCTDNTRQSDIIVLQGLSASDVAAKSKSLISESIEEERRLMYVALTRARRFVLITHVMVQGQQVMLPTRFLAEIPKGLVHRSTCYENTSGNGMVQAVADSYISLESDVKGSFTSLACSEAGVKCKTLHNAKSINRKGWMRSDKSMSLRDFDVEQSLKDIDDLLEQMEEPALCPKSVQSNEKDEAENIEVLTLNRDKKVEGSKRVKKLRCLDSQMFDDDDSDFKVLSKRQNS
ncbi:hypothetical protein KP509_1Z047600 [Ceratopteris richardii]|nr:hypothetical protein KP509_1Z047600 [Ceratopteris richardii]